MLNQLIRTEDKSKIYEKDKRQIQNQDWPCAMDKVNSQHMQQLGAGNDMSGKRHSRREMAWLIAGTDLKIRFE